MLFSSQDISESLNKHLPDVALSFQQEENWGSHNPEHRTLIRKYLESSQNLGSFSSISHTINMGGVLRGANPCGLDIEVKSRIKKELVARVSKQDEIAAALNFQSLWCAKEAAFKALKNYNQPSVLSKISIGHWQNIDSHTETFTLLLPESHSAPEQNRGIVIHAPEFLYAFFTFIY